MRRVRFNTRQPSRHPSVHKWAKGGASSSNPATTAHRDSVLARYSASARDQSVVQQEALDKLLTFNINDDEFDARTVDTSFSNFSAVSYKSFSGIERHWRQVVDNPVSKEICSLAAALAETVSKKSAAHETVSEKSTTESNDASEDDCELNSIETFAALCQLAGNTTSEDTLSAVYYLMSQCIRKVNGQVLRDQFESLAPIISKTCSTYFQSENTLLVKSLLECLVELLMKQQAKVLAQSTEYLLLFASFIHHGHPKVRKTCFRLINQLLTSAEIVKRGLCDLRKNPICRCLSKVTCEGLQSSSNNAQHTMRGLNLLRVLMPFMDGETTRTALETLLANCSGNSDPVVKKKAFQILHLYFSSDSPAEAVTAETNAQLLSALEELRPSFFDEDAMLAWLTVLDSAMASLGRKDPALFSSHLICFVTYGVTSVFPSSMDNVVRLSATIVGGQVASISEEVRELWRGSQEDVLSDVSKLAALVNEMTSVKYSSNWHILLPNAVATIYSALGKEFFGLLKESLLSLCVLRSNNGDSADVNNLLSSAVKAFGPENFLQCYPLNFCGAPDDDLTRSWILPLFRDSVSGAQLATWQNTFYPISTSIDAHLSSAMDTGSTAEAPLGGMRVLKKQVWSLLPAFCRDCTDAQTAFKPGFAKHLATVISDAGEMAPFAVRALTNLVTSQHGPWVATKFGKNYLPVLFNVYLSDGGCGGGGGAMVDLRRDVIGCIAGFVSQITDKQMLTKFFNTAAERMQSGTQPVEKLKLLLDIVRTILPHLAEPEVATTVDRLIPAVIVQPDLVKKTFQLMQVLLALSPDTLLQHYDQITPVLLHAFEMKGVTVKKHAIRCLSLTVDSLPLSQLHRINDIFPVVVLALAEPGSVRREALKALKVCCQAFLNKGKLDRRNQAVDKLVNTLTSASQPGANTMAMTTLMALKYICVLYRENLSQRASDRLLLYTSAHLKEADRPVLFTPAFDLIKTLISVVKENVLCGYCPSMVAELCEWNERTGLRYRAYVKAVLFRLVKKCGAELVDKNTPDSAKRMVRTLRKQINKEERLRKAARSNKRVDSGETLSDDESEYRPTSASRAGGRTINDILQELESDDDDEEETRTGATTKTGKSGKSVRSKKSSKASRVYITEDGTDVVDLAERSSARFISSHLPTQPQLKRRSAAAGLKANPFHVTPDGRLLIKEEEEQPDKDSDDDSYADLPDKDEDASSDSGLPAKRQRFSELVDKTLGPRKTSVRRKEPKGVAARRRGVAKEVIKTEYGTQYRAKKAKGDVKLAGKPDPYAFVPLDTKVLNRRKAKKLAGRFDGLVRSARRGATSSLAKRKGNRKK